MTSAQNSAVTSAMATSISAAPNRCRDGMAVEGPDSEGAMDIDWRLRPMHRTLLPAYHCVKVV